MGGRSLLPVATGTAAETGAPRALALPAGMGDKLRLEGQLFRKRLAVKFDELGVGGSAADEVELEAELGLSDGVSDVCRRRALWIDLAGRGGVGAGPGAGGSDAGARAPGDAGEIFSVHAST